MILLCQATCVTGIESTHKGAFCVGGRHYSGGRPVVKWVAHIRLHYPLFVLQTAISPVRFSTLKSVSLKEHSRVRLFKDDVASEPTQRCVFVKTTCCVFVKTTWYRCRSTRAFLDARRVMVTIAASRAWALSTLRLRSWMSHVFIAGI